MINMRKIGKREIFIFSIIFSTLILIQISYATDIQVTKSSVSQIKIGDILEVVISINNLESSVINVSVKETITGADPIDPPTFNIAKCPPGKFCIEPPYYSWNIILNPNSIYTINYKIKPLSSGNFIIPPTEVQTSSGEVFYSNSLNILVKCKANGVCEPNLGENYFTCSDDCPSGSKDDVCDLIKDGKCDPDCVPNTDPDCLATTTTISTTTTIPIEKPSRPIHIYLIIIAIIIAVMIFFIYKIKVVR